MAKAKIVGGISFTNAQHRVLELIDSNLKNWQIAESLDCSVKTVEVHLGAIYEKLGIPDRTPKRMQARQWYEKQKRRSVQQEIAEQELLTVGNQVSSGVLEDLDGLGWIDLSEATLSRVRINMTSGDMMGARAILPPLIKESKRRRMQSHNLQDRQRLEVFIARASKELAFSFTETAHWNLIQEQTSHYIDTLSELEHIFRSNSAYEEDWEMAMLIYPNILYIAGRTILSRELLKLRLKEVRTPYPKEICARLIPLTTADLARQGKIPLREAIRQYEEDRDESLNSIVSTSFTSGGRARVYEGFARACITLDLSEEASLWLKQAESEWETSKKDGSARPDVQAGLMRTRLSNIVRNPDSNSDIIFSEALRAWQVFHDGGRTRQKHQLIDELAKRPESEIKDFAEGLRHTLDVTIPI